MTNYAEYFERITYKPKYFLGERVYGKWNKIPFVGKVAIDTITSQTEGPKVIIFLDLPILYKKVWHTMITVKHRQIISKMVSIDSTVKKTKRK